jgi:hypothetical protein
MYKYNKRISSITLACYLIVITLGIVHYHKYNVNALKVFTSENTQTGYYKTDITSSLNCVVQQNISQLHHFNFKFDFSFNYFIQNVEEFSPTESTAVIPSSFLISNQLRAPPFYS